MIRAYDDYGNVVSLVEYESKIRADERANTINKIRNIFDEEFFNIFAFDNGTINFNNCSLMVRILLEGVKKNDF